MCAFVLFIRQTMNKTLSDKDARKHTKLVKETQGILHGELQEDFDKSVAAVVNAEIEKGAVPKAKKQAVIAAPALPAEPEPAEPVETDDWEDEDDESEDAPKAKKEKKEKKDKKAKKDKKEKKGGSDQ